MCVCVCVRMRMRMRMRLQSVFLQSAYLRSVCFVRVQLSVPSPFFPFKKSEWWWMDGMGLGFGDRDRDQDREKGEGVGVEGGGRCGSVACAL